MAKKLKGSGVKVCSVIGFPIGAMDSRSKACEAEYAISEGADELDMVINIGALKSKELKWAEEDIRKVKSVCNKNTILKVIIETFCGRRKKYWFEIRKTQALISSSCTGFRWQATAEDIVLMKNRWPALE